MIIDTTNGRIINSKEVYVHDDILEELCFCRKEKKLFLSVLTAGNSHNKEYTIAFLNVIGFEMTSCDFWGTSPHILDFEYAEDYDRTLIPKLFKEQSYNNSPFCPLKDQEKYIETKITFTSGDHLIVACESIIL